MQHTKALVTAPQVKRLALLGATVFVSFALLWSPYLRSQDSLLAVLHRVFPTQRGLFEDYVANFW